jgi:hypothetical protein
MMLPAYPQVNFWFASEDSHLRDDRLSSGIRPADEPCGTESMCDLTMQGTPPILRALMRLSLRQARPIRWRRSR